MTEDNQRKGRMRSLLANLTERITDLNDMVADIKKLDSYAVELESMIRTFTDTAHEGIVLVQDSKFVWVNKAACDISGYTENEILNMNLEQSTIPEDRDKLFARVEMTLAGDIAELPVEWRMLRKDRTIRYVNAFAYRVKFIEKSAIMVLFYDMTESKKIHNELMMRAQILDSVGDSIFRMDMAGNIVYVNEAFCERTGYSREELLETNIRKLVPDDRLPTFDIRLKQFSEHKEARYNTVAISKNGVRLSIEIRGKIIRQGNKAFLLAIARETSTVVKSE